LIKSLYIWGAQNLCVFGVILIIINKNKNNMKRICLIFFVILGLLGNSLYAQDRRVTGTVTDFTDGSTMPGVTVMVRGTNIGTVTDQNGRYELTVPADAVLVFSFIGMNTEEVTVGDRNIVNVAMVADVAILQEIVVTALGISRERKSLGYTVQEVDGDAVSRSLNPDLLTSLSGKVSGLEVRQSSGMPGAPSTVFIRGARSFSGDNTPLYVIDGMPIVSTNDYGSNVTGAAFTNRAIDLNPNDIESVTVLKGQAAAALYGLRASNGVVIITTKRGAGQAIGKPVVSFTSGVTVDNISGLPRIQTEYAQGTQGNFVPMNSFSWGPKIEDLPNSATHGGNNFGQPGMFFDPYQGQWVTPQGFNNAQNFFSDNGVSINNSISISQATQVGNFSMGFGSVNQDGIIPTTGMDRYNGRFSGDFNLNDKWEMGFTANYTESKIGKLPSGNDSYLFGVYGAPPSWDMVGSPYYAPDGDFARFRQISYRGGVGRNINWVLENNIYQEQTKRFFGNSYIEFKPVSNINIRYQIGADTYTNDNYTYLEAGMNQVHSAAQLPNPNKPGFTPYIPSGGSISNFGITRSVVNSLLTANLNYNLTDDINMNLLLGNEVDQNMYESYSSSGSTFTTPGWANLANTTVQRSGYNVGQRRTVGFFGNVDLSYQSLLFLNVTARNDIVSSMPRDNRSFFYPSASLSFVFTELDAFAENSVLPFGKLRVSYAEVGQAASAFLSVPPFVTGGASSGFLSSGISYPWRDLTGYLPSSTLYDPNLVPQNTQTYEVGIDLSFFNNRIGLDYTYFNQVASNQIFGVPLAGSTGYLSYVTNAGKMTGVGHEVILRARPVQSTNFNWDFSANFTKIVNEVVELAEGVENIALGGYVTPNIRASAGDTYPAIYGDQFLRDDEGRVLVNENPNSPNYGFPLPGGFGKIGDVSPDFVLSVTNSINFLRHFTLFGQLDWKNGGQMYSGSTRLMALYGTLGDYSHLGHDAVRGEEFIYPGYKADGTPNDIVRGGENDRNAMQQLFTNAYDAASEGYILGTSFVKLRELGFTVNIPRSVISSLRMERASLSFVARNITLWSELKDFDPEASQGQGNMQAGMDYMSLPQVTSYGLTLNVTF
jgi:TonB-linked SusC/RagA family outer membrane protein